MLLGHELEISSLKISFVHMTKLHRFQNCSQWQSNVMRLTLRFWIFDVYCPSNRKDPVDSRDWFLFRFCCRLWHKYDVFCLHHFLWRQQFIYIKFSNIFLTMWRVQNTPQSYFQWSDNLAIIDKNPFSTFLLFALCTPIATTNTFHTICAIYIAVNRWCFRYVDGKFPFRRGFGSFFCV